MSVMPEVTCCDAQSLAFFQESFNAAFSPSSCLSPGYGEVFGLILLHPERAPCSGASGLMWSFI